MSTYNKIVMQRAVRVVLDENKVSPVMNGLANIDTLTIDDIISDSIPRAMRMVLLAAPGTMIEDGKSLTVTEGEAGYPSFTLSHDVVATTSTETYIAYAGTKVVLSSLSGGNVYFDSESGTYLNNSTKVTVPAGTVVLDNTAHKMKELSEDTTVTITSTDSTKGIVPGLISSSSVSTGITLSYLVSGRYYAKVELPDDFLRILSVQMSDWDYALDTAAPRGSDSYAIEHNRVYSVGGTYDRPAAVITPDGKYMELFSSKDNTATLESFVYVALPTLDANGNYTISDKLYPSVIYICAALVCTTLGEFQKASAFENIAAQYMQTGFTDKIGFTQSQEDAAAQQTQ